MEDAAAADKAIELYNNYELQGKRIIVSKVRRSHVGPF
jgi:RNA recognition motif-containing protein